MNYTLENHDGRLRCVPNDDYCISSIGYQEIAVMPEYKDSSGRMGKTTWTEWSGLDEKKLRAILDKRVVPKSEQRAVPKGTMFGRWKYTGEHLNIPVGHSVYSIPISGSMTAGYVLGWLAHMTEKTWVSQEDLGYLVLALHTIHNFYWLGDE